MASSGVVAQFLNWSASCVGTGSAQASICSTSRANFDLADIAHTLSRYQRVYINDTEAVVSNTENSCDPRPNLEELDSTSIQEPAFRKCQGAPLPSG